MHFVAKFRPIWIFIAYLIALFMQFFWAMQVYTAPMLLVLTVISYVILYLLTIMWPVAITAYLAKGASSVNDGDVRKSRLLAIYALVGALLFPLLIFTARSAGFSVDSSAGRVIQMVLVLSIFYAIFRIFWIAADCLVTAETQSQQKSNRVIGTFLAFLFFPIGVFFLCRRIRIWKARN